MRKIFTLLFAVCFCTLGWSQGKTGQIVKATGKPVIDGSIDAIWSTANKYDIAANYKTELPTIGALGTTYWKGLWDNDGIYILIVVNDDQWYPNWAVTPAGNSYDYDNVETYYDTNYILEDGLGGQNPAKPNGHRQIAPASPKEADWTKTLSGTTASGGSYNYAYKVTAPTYSVEFFVPWLTIPDKDGFFFDKTATMGFDITVIDRDPGDTARKRAEWSNAGGKNENWSNMDDAGHLTFDDAPALVYVDNINIAAGQKITVDNGTLQIANTVIPADASYPQLTWSIVAGGTGKATIDAKTGTLKAIMNGTVLVKAIATDGGFAESDVVEVAISGQVIDKSDIFNSFNLIKNWNFTQTSTDGKATPSVWGSWVDTGAANGLADQKAPTVVDGAVVCVGRKSADNAFWHYQFFQNNMGCDPNVPYVLRFKSWADGNDIPVQVDFEDDNNNYTRYGLSPDANAISGKTEWNYTLTTEPKWFQFNIDAFDQIKSNTQQQVQFAFSGAAATIYMDSVLLVKKEEYQLSSKAIANVSNSLKVYPNPVGSANELTVSLAVAKGTVGIYNSIGQKLMEKAATSNNVIFNVSNLRKGVYFVRLSDGTTQKFVR